MPFEKLPGLMQLAVMEKRGEITASQFVEFAAKRRNATAGKSDDDPSSKSKTCRVGGKVYKIAKTRNGKALTCGGKTRAQLKGEKNAADVQKLRDAGGEFEGKIAGKPYKVNADMLEVANKMGVSSRMLAAGRVPSEVQTDLRRKFNQMTIGDTVTKPKAEPKPKITPPPNKLPANAPFEQVADHARYFKQLAKDRFDAGEISDIEFQRASTYHDLRLREAERPAPPIAQAPWRQKQDAARFAALDKAQEAWNEFERIENEEKSKQDPPDISRINAAREAWQKAESAKDKVVGSLDANIVADNTYRELQAQRDRRSGDSEYEVQKLTSRMDESYEGLASNVASQGDAWINQRLIDTYAGTYKALRFYDPTILSGRPDSISVESVQSRADQIAARRAEDRARQSLAEQIKAQSQANADRTRAEAESLLNQTVKQTPLTPEQLAKFEADAARYEASPESKLARAQREKEEAVAKQRRDEQRAEAKEYQRTQLGLFDPTPPTPDEIKRANAESFPARDATWNAAAQQVARETPNAKGFTPTQRAYAIAQANKQLSDLAGEPVPRLPQSRAAIEGLMQFMSGKALSAAGQKAIDKEFGKKSSDDFVAAVRFLGRFTSAGDIGARPLSLDIPNPMPGSSSRYEFPSPLSAIQFLSDIGANGKEKTPIEFEENGAMWFEFAEYELDPGIMALMNDPNLSAMYEILAEIAPELIAIREYPAETNA
jgi:hypothetical protein